MLVYQKDNHVENNESSMSALPVLEAEPISFRYLMSLTHLTRKSDTENPLCLTGNPLCLTFN